MWLIVGLGNPGTQYKNTRHNAGFWLLDQLAARLNTTFEQKKHYAFAKTVWSFPVTKSNQTKYSPNTDIIPPIPLLLMKPLTFMNRSGPPVAEVASFYKILPDRIIVAHDDLDLPPGKLRYKRW